MIERESSGEVTILRMAHGRANALDLELLRAIDATLSDEEEGDARAYVLTGGGSIFCAGVDLPRLLRDGTHALHDYLAALEAALERLLLFPKPVVAAVNGHAIAGGAILACACDRRVAALGKLTLGVPELRVGVPFPPLALEILRLALAPAAFRELALFGRNYGVEDAQRLGLVDELVAPEALVGRARELAADLATIEPSAFTHTKHAIARPALDRAARETTATVPIADAWATDEVQAAIRAFVERTLRK